MIFVEEIENLSLRVPVELVEKAAQKTLEHQSAPADAELTVVLSDDVQLRELNLQWMGIDAPTDVLSFPSAETDPESGHRYLGDILISVQRANEQAQAVGHPVEAEVQLLVVHGVLHLLGHDHTEAGEKAEMWLAQGEILAALGLGAIKVERE